jgi:hypothetical protein
MPWHDCLLPIGPDYLAIERAVTECAMIGCDTIWIVGHRGTTPLVKKRIGEFINDPVSLSKLFPETRTKHIPIFYCPLREQDIGNRDSLSWSTIYGADAVFRISAFLSKWILPKRFYCCFPYGITSDDFVRQFRARIRKDKNIVFSYKNKTVKDNLHINFTFEYEDFKNCRDIIRKRNLQDWDERKTKKAKEMTLSDVFSGLNYENSEAIELPWFYDVSSWEKYCNYTSSPEAKQLNKKRDVFMPRSKVRLFPSIQEEEQESIKNVQSFSTNDKIENESS